MKTLWSTLLLVAVVAGCSTPGPEPEPATSKPAKASQPTDTNTVVITPSFDLIGQVTSVNGKSRFVILAFPTATIPAKEQKLNVYRNDRKVGELRVTGPTEGTITAADILAGEILVGDEARIN